VIVYDVDADAMREVTEAEAGHGMLAYARRLKAGSVERAEVERQALGILEEAGEWPPWKRARGKRRARGNG
jgi:hypothetical protein